MDAILNNSTRSMKPAGHHSDSDSALLPLLKSAITWFGGILQGWRKNAYLAAGLLDYAAFTVVKLMGGCAPRKVGGCTPRRVVMFEVEI